MTQQDDFDLAVDIEAALVAVALGATSGSATRDTLLQHVTRLRGEQPPMLRSAAKKVGGPRPRLVSGLPETSERR